MSSKKIKVSASRVLWFGAEGDDELPRKGGHIDGLECSWHGSEQAYRKRKALHLQSFSFSMRCQLLRG